MDLTDIEDWSASANDAVQVSLRSPISGKEVAAPFHPTYTYPIYGEAEAIYGYKDLRVSLMFAADDMESCVDITWSEKVAKIGDVEAEDVVKPLKDVLPQLSFSQSTTEFISSLKARKTPFTPPGVLQSTIVLGGKSYEIWRSSIIDKKCRDLLSNIQIFVLLYIEGGNSLALDDEEWTNERWDVFFLYERTPHGYGFIGYSTVYCYFYFDINNSDLSRVRLSQFIILPPYQRAGLGSRFYDEIFHVYLQSAEVREITVEDPSEEFSDLRDRCDMARLGLDKDFKAINIAIIMQKPRPMLNQLRERFKMPCRQFLRCVEMKLLRDIDTTDKKAHKAYRLFVKSRIYKQHIDVLSQLDRLERIDKLDETFHHQEDDYKRLLTMMESTSVVEVQDDIPSTKRVHEAVDRSKPVKRAKLSAPDREP